MHNRRDSEILAAKRVPNKLLLLRREQDHSATVISLASAAHHHHSLPVLDRRLRQVVEPGPDSGSVHETAVAAAASRIPAHERHRVVGVLSTPRRARGRR